MWQFGGVTSHHALSRIGCLLMSHVVKTSTYMLSRRASGAHMANRCQPVPTGVSRGEPLADGAAHARPGQREPAGSGAGNGETQGNRRRFSMPVRRAAVYPQVLDEVGRDVGGTVKAWQVTRHGEPEEVLELVEVPRPEPGPGQILVRLLAAAANFPDV